MIWPAEWLCGALSISRGRFYAWLIWPRSQRSRSDEKLDAKVRASFPAATTAQFATETLVRAIWRGCKPDPLLHHSDCGSQYTSEQFQWLMADQGLVCSMSRSRNVRENAAMGLLLVVEDRTTRRMYRTRDYAKADVFDYIERFFNPKRRHSTIGYLSPMEFERQAGLA